MMQWLINIGSVLGVVASILSGAYFIGDKTGWRWVWSWEVRDRAFFDKADNYALFIKMNRTMHRPDDAKLIGIYCGLTWEHHEWRDTSIVC